MIVEDHHPIVEDPPVVNVELQANEEQAQDDE